jgi:hypothetical protein
MNRMAIHRLPPRPDAPQAEHDAYSEEVTQRERARVAEEAQRRIDALVRTMGEKAVVAASHRLRLLERILWKASSMDEASWREVRDEAGTLLRSPAGEAAFPEGLGR